MWGDIILSLVTSVGEAIVTKKLDGKKLKKFNDELYRKIYELFTSFADSSLDCSDFGRLIESNSFYEMLRNYFCTLKDGSSKEEYFNKLEKFIIKECITCNPIEVRQFVKKIEELYNQFLDKVINNSVELNAFFQLITISHREIIGKIIESEDNMMRYIKSLNKKSINIVESEIESYHNICISEYGLIKFSGIEGVENKKPQNINEYYVENTFSYYYREILDTYKCDNSEIAILRLNEFFNYNNKVILIGGAGLGKSTTLNYLFCNYEILFGVKAVKIKIDLKEYAKDIVEDKRDILWCLSIEFSKRISKKKYKLDDIENILSCYLDEGKCLIILDALDEIPSQAIRDKVRDEIANFSQVYFHNRLIISTREVGYLKNRFDDSFLHIKINDFDDDQLKKYSSNWFTANYKKSEFEEFWEKFNLEIDRSKCREIIRNPIVLILALIIFDIEKNLPNRRVDFYKKCIKTFLEVRENRKAAFIMDRDLRNLLGDDSIVPKVAYYKFNKVKDDIGYRFTNEEFKEAIIKAIEVVNIRNWIDTVNQFAKYMIDRTELIKEIDENVLDFTHKTFYEYFLAVYFSKEYDHNDLMELLLEWIGDSNYDELARLIVEVVIEKNDSNQHKKLVNYLFEKINMLNTLNKKENAKAIDIFSIISDLYRNEQLLAKFHEQYNKCILYNSNLINRLNNRSRMREKKEVLYDSAVLAEIFTCIINENEGELSLLIDAMYYLDDEFRDEVVRRSNNRLAEVALLFEWVRKFCNKEMREKREKREKSQVISIEYLKKYLINGGKNFLLTFPSVFISYVDLICLDDTKEVNQILFNYSFSPSNVFKYYTSPKVLYTLISNSFSSWKEFLLLLICLIQCAKESTNFLIGFVFDDIRRVEGKDENLDNQSDYIHKIMEIWSMLNKTNCFEEFVTIIESHGLFNDKYLIIYKQLYDDYQLREKSLPDYRINNYFDSLK